MLRKIPFLKCAAVNKFELEAVDITLMEYRGEIELSAFSFELFVTLSFCRLRVVPALRVSDAINFKGFLID